MVEELPGKAKARTKRLQDEGEMKGFLCEVCGAPAVVATEDVVRRHDENGMVLYAPADVHYYCLDHVQDAKVTDAS